MFATISNSFIITTCTGGTRVENIKCIKLCLLCVGPSAWFQAGAAMTDIFIDTRTIGAWARQTSYSGNTLPGSSDLGLEETFPPASRFIIYLSRYLGSWTGPGLGCPLAWSQAQYPWPLQTALCGCHGDVCVGAHWSLSPRCGGAMGGMSWSLVMAAPASDTVPSPVLVSPHDARRWTPDAKNAHERERAKMRQHWNIIILQLRKPLKQTNKTKTKHDKCQNVKIEEPYSY